MLGKKLGHYEIVAKIGEGGMGEVWKATDTRLGRSVAIKVLPSHLSGNAETRARFEREARAISSISHPHICTLHDVGEADGVEFLVMEHLEGETLADRLLRDRLPLAQALRIGTEIAGALDAAHRRGIVHRDLKPSNVMLTRNGVKLLDFGLAKLAETPVVPAVTAAVSEPRSSQPLTERGTILGTFRYMAPEQLEGQDADARSDIFALGAVLYEMTAGRPAFEAKSRASLIAAILERDPPPLSSIEPMTPPALDRTIRRCLAKDPDARWQSAADVGAELSWIGEESARAGVPAVVSARRRSRERLLWVLAVPLLAAAVALGVALLRQSGGDTPVVRASILPPENKVFDLNSYEPGPAALSPDGTMIAFLTEGTRDSLWVHVLATGAPRLLLEGTSLCYPFWSGDGRTIGFFAEEEMRRISAAGGPALTICDVLTGKGGAWNEEDVIVFAREAAAPLFRVAATGGEATQVTELDSTRSEQSHRFPSFLPDGRRFLYFARTATAQREAGLVLVGSLDGDAPRQVIAGSGQALFASGRLLFVRETTLFAQPFDLGRLALRGDPVPIADSVELIGGAAYAAFSASGNGVLVYHTDQQEAQMDLVWYDRTGAEGARFGEPGNFETLAFSPDGTRLAAAIQDPDTGRTDIWIYDMARELRGRFTFDRMDDNGPCWSADGTQLYFASNRGGRFDLYRKALTGPDSEELILKSGGDKFPQFVTPDGSRLVFAQGPDLWILPLEEAGGTPSLLMEAANSASGSKDGRWLSFVSAESGRPEVYITSLLRPGRRWQLSTEGSFAGGWWSATDMLYVDLEGAVWLADVIPEGSDLRIGKPQPYLGTPNRIENGALHPDGERNLLAQLQSDPESKPMVL
ncbi:MAG: protein kinase domain-containing protein, partial [Candidatus Eiseniibacteriota bacterium]